MRWGGDDFGKFGHFQDKFGRKSRVIQASKGAVERRKIDCWDNLGHFVALDTVLSWRLERERASSVWVVIGTY